jgi:hypothetical protein
MKFEVVFDVITQSLSSPYAGYSSRTDLQDRKMIVEAGSSQQAERQVEAMFGGRSNVRVKVAKIVY